VSYDYKTRNHSIELIKICVASAPRPKDKMFNVHLGQLSLNVGAKGVELEKLENYSESVSDSAPEYKLNN